MPYEAFKSSKYSIAHACRHIDTFETKAVEFVESSPLGTVREAHEAGGIEYCKMKLIQPVPLELPGIAFDVVSNLRAALDQAGRDVAFAATGHERQAAFPFGETQEDAERCWLKGSRRVPRPIFDYMMELGPFRGGNELLWALNRLCNTHKHNFVTAAAVGFATAGTVKWWGEPIEIFEFPPAWDVDRNEMIFASVMPGKPFDMQFDLKVRIALTQLDFLANRPALAVLREMSVLVTDIVLGIEKKARELHIV